VTNDEVVRAVVDRHRGVRGPLLPILLDVQAELGCVSADSVATIADELNLSRADVHGVRSFYPDLSERPRADIDVQVCRAEACQSVGGDAVADESAAACADRGDADTRAVFCLGNCALAPSAAVNGRVIGLATLQRVMAAVDAAAVSQSEVSA
jgi:formate dehydrogenase subunit gamma